jgi:hypothetical protein
VKTHLSHWISSAPSRAEVLHHCATGAGLVAVNRPIERLLSRCASLTVALVAAALLAACGGGGGGGDAAAPTASSVAVSGTGAAVAAAPTASSVAITGTAQVGQTLTGSYAYADANNDPQGASTFRWLRGGAAITGATASTYTLVALDQGNTITFEVTPVSTVAPTTGTPVASSPTVAVAGVGVPAAPTASSVAITGTAQVGQTLTGSYAYADANNDPQGISTFRWLRGGAAITGATASTYTLVGTDLGNTITFEVTPVSTVAPTTGTPVVSAAVNVVPSSLGMKLLVISAEGTAPSYLGITSILDQIGVPYDKIVLKGTTPTTLQMEAGTLSDSAGNGKYQGIILETGDLAAYNALTKNYPSAMTAAQWAMLRQYQHDFGVRSATMYTRPALTIDVNNQSLDLTYGLTTPAGEISTDSTPLNASFTTAGAQIFDYLNTATPISIKNAYTYLSLPAPANGAIPLLVTADNKAIVSTYTGAGWENLAITADENPELTHTLLLGYGVVNWVTRGVFLGERKIYLSAQPDDVFIPDDLWDPATLSICGDPIPPAAPSKTRVKECEFRITGTDYNQLRAWQTAIQALPNASQIRLELPFNGSGYNQALANDIPDTLTAAVIAFKNVFRWINHTWNHANLDAPVAAGVVTSELTQNHNLAASLGFTGYNKDSFIQPDISGLENSAFYTAAQAFGLTNILMDTSKTYANFIPSRSVVGPISPNTGFYSTLDAGNPKIIIIPRYPTNLYYNVSTPEEWLSEYNYFYAPGGLWPTWDHALTYSELLDKESEVLVRYMLKYNANSWMFHQANLRAYPVDSSGNPSPYPYTSALQGTKSTLGDLLNAVTNKYNNMYNLPIQNLSQHEIAALMRARMTYNTAIAGGLRGRIVYGPPGRTIELTNSSGVSVVVPVTGVNVGGTAYGGQTISTFSLAAGGSTTFATP